jgi:hypothetical protein
VGQVPCVLTSHPSGPHRVAAGPLASVVRPPPMPQFIHLADSKAISRIERNGIATSRARIEGGRGVYCTPVCRDFFRTHQWLRELKRTGVKSIHAVQFFIPAAELVWVGRYNADHIKVKASEAVRIFEEHNDGLGLEILIPQRVSSSSIRRIYVPEQIIGWRYYPEAKGKPPFCGCRFCNRGSINASRVVTEGRD